MSDAPELFLRLLVIVNPFAALLVWSSLAEPLPRATARPWGRWQPRLPSRRWRWRRSCAEPILDLLSVSAPTWQMAAGALLVFSAFPAFLTRDPYIREPYGSGRTLPRWAVARMACGLANPAAVAALIFFGADSDLGAVLPALTLVLAITGVLVTFAPGIEERIGRLPLREAGRLLAAILVVMSIATIIDAVNSV